MKKTWSIREVKEKYSHSWKQHPTISLSYSYLIILTTRRYPLKYHRLPSVKSSWFTLITRNSYFLSWYMIASRCSWRDQIKTSLYVSQVSYNQSCHFQEVYQEICRERRGFRCWVFFTERCSIKRSVRRVCLSFMDLFGEVFTYLFTPRLKKRLLS